MLFLIVIVTKINGIFLDAFEQERAALQPPPETGFDCDDALDVQAGKTPYVRYDLNDYSIPHEFVRQTLQVRASPQQVRIYNATACLATHPRCYDKGQHIADPQHIDALRRFKSNSARHSGQHRLYQQAPDSEVFLQHNVELGHRLSQSVRLLTRWLDQYGNTALVKALQEALAQSCYHTDGVLQILERHREQHQRPVPLSIQLPDKALDHSPLSPASLDAYDRLVAVDTGADDDDPDEPCNAIPAGATPDD